MTGGARGEGNFGGKGGGGGWAGHGPKAGGGHDWAKMGKGGEREKEKVFPIFHFLYPLFRICLILQFTQPQIKKVHNPA
jgi:hypothetical protein